MLRCSYYLYKLQKELQVIKGLVTETHGERAKVRVNFKETTERGLRAYIDCWNPISAHPGDNVIIDYRKVDEKKAKYFQIALPVLCLAAGGIFGHALAVFFQMDFWFWPFVAGSIVVWLFVAYNYIKIFRRDAISKKEQLTVVEIEPAEFLINTDEEVEELAEKPKSFLYSGR